MGDISLLFGALFVPVLLGGSSLISPLVALAKGYKPWFWLLACGPIGLVTITCLPSLKSAKTPEELDRLENRADFIGAVLSCIAIFVGVIPVVFVLNQGFLQPRPTGIPRSL